MKTKQSLLIITFVFVVSRVIFYLAGVRFDTTPLFGIQLIDPILLKEKLFQSLFYLHGQPPLFNLFVGVILKLFPESFSVVFHGLYMLAGYFIALGFYTLQRRLNIKETLAAAFTCFFIINPACILYENWLMYTYFILGVIIWSAVFLHRYISHHQTNDILVFFILTASLVLTYSSYHLVWFLFLWCMLLVFVRGRRKQIITAAIIPLMIIAALYVKNLIMFGSFTTSKTWMAFNLLEMSAKNVPSKTIDQLFREGKIKTYDPFIPPKTGVQILDDIIKPSTGELNWHSQQSLINADTDIYNAKFFLKHYPQIYLDSVTRAYQIYFFPGPTDVTFHNRPPIEFYENIYNFMFWHLNSINNQTLYKENLLLWSKFDTLTWDDLSLNLYAMVVIFYLGLFLAGFIWIYLEYKRSNRNLAFILTLLFMLLNIFYISVGNNFFAWIGSNRYRFVVEPFYLTILALCLNRFLGGTRPQSKEGNVA